MKFHSKAKRNKKIAPTFGRSGLAGELVPFVDYDGDYDGDHCHGAQRINGGGEAVVACKGGAQPKAHGKHNTEPWAKRFGRLFGSPEPRDRRPVGDNHDSLDIPECGKTGSFLAPEIPHEHPGNADLDDCEEAEDVCLGELQRLAFLSEQYRDER